MTVRATTSKPSAAWAWQVPIEGERGPALTDALLAEELDSGATLDVLWAYAEALPELVPDLVATNVIPLAFARGALRAAVVPQPVSLPGLMHVQTRSPDVCDAVMHSGRTSLAST